MSVLEETYSYHVLGPEPTDKKILAIVAFAKALTEVTTDVDDDEDPKDSIKEYGKDVAKALILHGIGEASKIAKIAKKAWRPKKTKIKPTPYKQWGGKRAWQNPLPAAGIPPVIPPASAAPGPAGASRPLCQVCGRTGHNEATCYTAHPELRVTKPG